MSAHTKGLLRVSDEHPTLIKTDYRPLSEEGELVASAKGYPNSGLFPSPDEAVANARRLVACWNACDGISTKWLESGLVDPFTTARACKEQRDELLAALEDVLKRIDDGEHWWMDEPSRGGLDAKMIRAAIAKARSE